IAEARRGVERHDTEPVRQILLASSAIPGAFPPRAIDGGLFVDGGITGNILYGGRGARRDSDDSFVAQWRSAYPGGPIPKIRYWILFNNEVRWPPEVVQPKW